MSAIEILLVEDSLGEARLTIEAFKEHKITNQVHHVSDGVEAMAFLHKKGKYGDFVTPDLILLDFNMPKMDGCCDVLANLKEDELLKRIPVVVLTTSKAEKDVVKSYDLNVNFFISKPLDLDQFLDVIHSISNFWLSVVTLPKSYQQEQ